MAHSQQRFPSKEESYDIRMGIILRIKRNVVAFTNWLLFWMLLNYVLESEMLFII